MTKKSLLLLIGIALMILLPMGAFAQTGMNNNPPVNNGPKITEKQNAASANYNFALTYPGVTMFMEDLEIYEPQNYELLLPAYGKIEEKHVARKRNQTIGLILGGGITAASITAVVLGFTALATPDERFGGTSPNSGLIIGGTAGFIVGLTIPIAMSWSPQIKDEDYYRLINAYNRNNPETPIEIKRSLEIH